MRRKTPLLSVGLGISFIASTFFGSTFRPSDIIMCPGTEFYWDYSYNGVCLQKIKDMLCETPILRYFDHKEANIELQCDASQSGLGACLMQSGQPIGYVACALTQAEENYAQIEKELLAVVFAMEKYDTYLAAGVHTVLESDHKPLETIFLPVHP